uniref:Uncharacterized protein n=1 Tax=Arundo donax TaxID=35708 RepID=A0A0A9EKR7_ARUDO
MSSSSLMLFCLSAATLWTGVLSSYNISYF